MYATKLAAGEQGHYTPLQKSTPATGVGPDGSSINIEDFEVEFEARSRRTDASAYLSRVHVAALLEGPEGTVCEIGWLGAWRWAPGYFEFSAFDDDLYWILDAASNETDDAQILTAAQKIVEYQEVLVEQYDATDWNGNCTPVGLILFDFIRTAPPLRETGLDLQLMRELRAALCGAYALAATIRPFGKRPSAAPGTEEYAAWEQENRPEVQRLMDRFTASPDLGTRQICPSNPSFMVGYWPAQRTLPTEDRTIELTEEQVRAILEQKVPVARHPEASAEEVSSRPANLLEIRTERQNR